MNPKSGIILRKTADGSVRASYVAASVFAAGDGQFLDDPVKNGSCALRPLLHSEVGEEGCSYPPGTMLLICRRENGDEYRAIVKMPFSRRKQTFSNISHAITEVKHFDRSFGAIFAEIHAPRGHEPSPTK